MIIIILITFNLFGGSFGFSLINKIHRIKGIVNRIASIKINFGILF